MAKEKDGIDFGQTEELVKFGAERSKLIILISAFIAFSGFLTAHALYSIYDHWTDQSIPLTVCPKSFDLDSPVLMTPINQTDSIFVQDRWIRGFVRKLILNSYPRTGADAEKFFPYMVSVTEGEVRHHYESFVNDMDAIKGLISAGSKIRFYAKNSTDIRIRPTDNRKDRWVVEVDGYLIKDLGGIQERSTPTLQYTIEARPATRSNPSGLVVVDAQMDKIADYVSGRKVKEILQEDEKK